VRWDHELPAAADLHALDALVPARDHLADAEPELQRRPAVVRRVELLAGGVCDTHVVDRHRLSGAGLGPVPLGDVGDDEVGGRLGVEELDLRLVHAATLADPSEPRRGAPQPWWT
jgi:hypothetical protein